MTPADQPAGEDVPFAMADVMERQARVARAEANLAAARRRLGESFARLRRVASERGQEVPPLAAAVLQANGGQLPVPADGDRSGTLRARLVTVMEAHQGEVFTPARLAPMVGSQNRDSIRNTLLVLAAKGLIDKVGVGQYQARQLRSEPLLAAPGDEKGRAR